jgi:hypothetical protein
MYRVQVLQKQNSRGSVMEVSVVIYFTVIEYIDETIVDRVSFL